MGESPPPQVIQLAQVLEGLASSLVPSGRLSDSEVFALGVARGLTENLILAYPALTMAADGSRYPREGGYRPDSEDPRRGTA